MTRLFAGLGLLLLTAPRCLAADPPLPPGKPAGVQKAELNGSAPIVVGAVVATAVGFLLASAVGDSTPVTSP